MLDKLITEQLTFKRFFILYIFVVIFIYVCPPFSHLLNRKLNPFVKEAMISVGGELIWVNKYQQPGFEIVSEEFQHEKDESLRAKKMEVIAYTVGSLTSSQDTRFGLSLLQKRDETLNELIILDPNSALIPHTVNFIQEHNLPFYDNTLEQFGGTVQPKP